MLNDKNCCNVVICSFFLNYQTNSSFYKKLQHRLVTRKEVQSYDKNLSSNNFLASIQAFFE